MNVSHHLAPTGAALSLWHADSRDALRLIPDNSIDSCVTDPPYALVSISKRFGAENAAPAKSGKSGVYARASAGFMGQTWDTGECAFAVEFWQEVLRVLKPGAHLLAFGGTRTYHRLACAIEDAGFEIRDQIGWLYGSGFPKSHNLEGEWDGWGTALKPAWEPIMLARKPLIGTVAANMQKHRTGGLNIGACRVEGETRFNPPTRKSATAALGSFANCTGEGSTVDGRWPANVLHDGSEEVLAAFPDAPGQLADASTSTKKRENQNTYGAMKVGSDAGPKRGDSGSAARFFYGAKASKKDRNDGCEHLPKKPSGMVSETSGQHITRRDGNAPGPQANNHPTVKPTELMRYLCRLVTPPHGVVLDPFMGSGSTGRGAVLEGFGFVGIERDGGYWEIAKARVGVLAP